MTERERVPPCVITAPELRIAYAENPKAGCSAVKIALWQAIDAARDGASPYLGNPHAADAPWSFVDRPLLEKETFGVVRDPFARLYSGFYSKLRGRNPRSLAYWQRLGRTERGTFADFVRLLPHFPTDTLDRHWNLQSDNVREDVEHIFRLENAAALEAYLIDRIGQPLGTFRFSRYKVSLRDAYTAELEAIVREVYAPDFERFDYPDVLERHP